MLPLPAQTIDRADQADASGVSLGESCRLHGRLLARSFARSALARARFDERRKLRVCLRALQPPPPPPRISDFFALARVLEAARPTARHRRRRRRRRRRSRRRRLEDSRLRTLELSPRGARRLRPPDQPQHSIVAVFW